jgi:hypothetical protein
MNGNNWLQIVPKDVLDHILTFGDEGVPFILTMTSQQIASRIHPDKNLRFDLGTYGSKYGYLEIIKLAVGNITRLITNKYIYNVNPKYSESGRSHITIHLYESDPLPFVRNTAAYYGHLEMFMWACDSDSTILSQHLITNIWYFSNKSLELDTEWLSKYR